MVHEVVLHLPAEAGAPRQARTVARQLLVDLGCDESTTADAALLVSELVTNAVVHAATTVVELHLELQGNVLHVEVADDDARAPEPDVSGRVEGGRGLHLVSALADRWGAAPRPGARGKVVWFDLPCPVVAM